MDILNEFMKGRSPSNVAVVIKAFSGKQNLNLHIESVHGGIKPFMCNDCDKDFSLEGNLNGHIESVHEGKKPLKCNFCDANDL